MTNGEPVQPRNNKKAGFTLIELMVVLAVAIIIASVGIPSMYRLIADNRLATYTNELVADINLARSEAIKRSQRVIFCKVACNEDADWNAGWVVFEDIDNDNVVDPNEVIRLHESLSNTVDIDLNIAGNRLVYNARGLLDNGAMSTFTISDNNDEANSRRIVISMTGRARTEIVYDTPSES